MCSEHALSLIENYIAKRQRSCVAQSVEQSPGLREVLGSNPGTADQCFSARVRKKYTMHTEVSSPIVAACSLSTWVRRDVIIAELAYHVGVTNIAEKH